MKEFINQIRHTSLLLHSPSTMPTVAPYGEWVSPISAEFITSSTVQTSNLTKDESTGLLYYVTLTSANKGRSTIVARLASASADDDEPVQETEITPAPFNAKTRVHEYGGACFTLGKGFLVASNAVDGRLYKIDTSALNPVTSGGSSPSSTSAGTTGTTTTTTTTTESSTKPSFPQTALTPENPNYRYADIEIHPSQQFLICVREDHTIDEPQKVINTLVVVRLDTTEPKVDILMEGCDFYSSPRFNPVRTDEMSFYSWQHPFMTWDHTQLWYLKLEIGLASTVVKVIETPILLSKSFEVGRKDSLQLESANQPRFAKDGTLYFISDKTGWWNLYSFNRGRSDEQFPRLVLKQPMEAEFQGPAWRFGASSFSPLVSDPTRLACIYTKDGRDYLSIVDTILGTMENVSELLFTDLSTVLASSNDVRQDVLLMDVSSFNIPSQVIEFNLETLKTRVLYRSSSVKVPLGFISEPKPITFKTTGDLNAYALFFPPTNQDFEPVKGTLPPLRVLSHGGPTAHFTTSLSWSVNYFTSRGFAVVMVNYGGSTGYGREYRSRLKTLWGVVDVDDCSAAATYLVDRGLVDGNKLAIVGSSAGGYTTLACLAFRNVFKAGVSHYGIGDLETLAKDTHKFELLYPESLIGPYPAAKELYRERSPIYSADKISCPVAFFQGLDDKVVPPNQAEMMVKALKDQGVKTSLVLFEGEGHGFRLPENVQKALRGEVTFLGKMFGFKPFDAIELEIS